VGRSIDIVWAVMRRRLLVTILFCVPLIAFLSVPSAPALPSIPLPRDSAHTLGHHGHASEAPDEAWEGSAKGIAYSERNHHIAGFLVVMMGLAELTHVLRLPSLRWARLLLPSALIFAGLFLLIWSDHEAWPIGSLGFGETFVGGDPEIMQHKIYGILALMVGSVEIFRRLGRIGHKAWASPLPLMAIVGGLMLFGHSHGFHPSAQKIAVHHAIMGTMAITAGSSKLLSAWIMRAEQSGSTKWEWVWVSLILLIGAQLLLYSE
jgi:putative copper resistance protein D